MMTKDEALKIAIDTLQNAKRRHFYCEDTYYSCPKHEDGCADDRQPYKCNCGADELNAEIEISINACKEALEQPSNMVTVPLDKLQDMQRRLKALEQPAQEPEYVYINPVTKDAYYLTKGENTHPNKEWQGLTEDEITELAIDNSAFYDDDVGVLRCIDMSGIDFARAIEQALKEKNHVN